MSRPKVSVIIPVYNEQLRLHKCLDSVCGQTLHDIEVLCVNDGSTDGSGEILSEYAEKDGRIAVITQENRGLSAARNRAFLLAGGEYVYFLDSDDSVIPEALETAYSIASPAGLDILLFDSAYDEDSTDLPSGGAYFCREREYADICSGKEMLVHLVSEKNYLSNVWLSLYRREFITGAGLRFREGALYEDNYFSFAALLKAQRTRHLQKTLHRAYLGENSITRGSVTSLHVDSLAAAIADMTGAALMAEFDGEEQKTACLRAIDWVSGLGRYHLQRLYDTNPEWKPDLVESRMYELLGMISGDRQSAEERQVREDGLPEWVARSATWRIGRVITFFPGKIKRAFRAWKRGG